MARKESFDKAALKMLWGTPFSNGEFYRVVQSTGMGEYVKVKDGKVVEFTREPHDDNRTASPKKRDSLKRTENDMELRGIVTLDGTPIKYYGTEKGWQKFKTEWEEG